MNTVVSMETVQIDTYMYILHEDPEFVNMGSYPGWQNTVIMSRAFIVRTNLCYIFLPFNILLSRSKF
ncbi:hypothetical protein ACS0TY_015534 [Phlomoides rotata]